jgi:hypothetical protein
MKKAEITSAPNVTMPQQSLHSHIGAAHNHIRKHKWTQCDYATTRKYQLVLHIKAEHGVTIHQM